VSASVLAARHVEAGPPLPAVRAADQRPPAAASGNDYLVPRWIPCLGVKAG